MSAATLAGLLLIVVPLAFNAAFALLAARFDYPDVLRQPTAEVLAKFPPGGSGIALTQTGAVPGWLGLVGVVIGPVLMLCSLEFVGGHEPGGWTLAARLTPVAYVAWSLWLIATGVALLA